VRTLIDGVTPPGTGALVWDGRAADGAPVGAGMYWCRVDAGPETQVQKLLVVK
jgi:hypothetical protein